MLCAHPAGPFQMQLRSVTVTADVTGAHICSRGRDALGLALLAQTSSSLQHPKRLCYVLLKSCFVFYFLS